MTAPTLATITAKVHAGERLTADDALALFLEPDLLAIGQLANHVREKRHGDRTFFNKNMRIEVTNVCMASCLFCSFAKLEAHMPGAHTMSLEEAWRELETRMDDPPGEVHVVNGLHPGLPFSYYEDLLKGFKRIKPDLHLKCFTGVEIHFFAQHYKLTVREVLERLVAAGLDSLPGGGAEIFHPDVRKRISDDKATGDEWLEVHRVAHAMGLRSNATMLYGHIETFEHRVDHGVVGEHQVHPLDAGDRLGGARTGACALGLQGQRLLGAAVPDGDVVTLGEHAAYEAGAHQADTEECDLHGERRPWEERTEILTGPPPARRPPISVASRSPRCCPPASARRAGWSTVDRRRHWPSDRR
jgi:hypothetical protein